MVCCCSLAGTRACLTCANNPYSEYFYNNYIPVVSRTYKVSTPIDTGEEFLKIISNLNQHIDDLRKEVETLRKEKYERESQTIGKDIRTETCTASSAEGVCYKTEEDHKAIDGC